MRKIKKVLLQSTAVTTTAGLLTWAALGQLPVKEKHAHHPMSFSDSAAKFFKMTASSAHGAGYTQNLVNIIRNSMGMVAGYGSRASYVTFVCGGTDPGSAPCDGPPQEGIVGAATSIVNSLPAIAGTAGITSCETAPSTGTYSGHDSSGTTVNLIFSTPTHHVPTGWVNGDSTFSHRVVFSANLSNIGPSPVPLKVAYEFNCGDDPASYVAMSMDVDATQLPGWARDITIYNGGYSSTEKGIEVYMSEHLGSAVRGVDAMRIAYNETTHKFKLWSLINSSVEPVSGQSTQMASKVMAHGDYVTGVALVFARSIFGQAAGGDNTGTLDTSMASFSGSATAGAESDPGQTDMSSNLLVDAQASAATHGSPRGFARMACINFNTPTVSNVPGHASCAGLSLASPGTPPAVNASGTWNIQYLFGLTAHLEHVN